MTRRDYHRFAPAWMHPATRFVGRQFRRLQHDVRSALARVHPSPVFVLGNQKSGTSAIAALLARSCGLSVSLDMLQETRHPIFQRVLSGSLRFDDYVRANRWEFSHDVVKEPNLTLLYPQIAERFPDSPAVFVVRDPRDNLRSLLNRLEIPGHLERLEARQLASVNPNWQLVLDGRWLGIPGDHYIEQLAGRWLHCVQVYLAHAPSLTLCRYEDFQADKLSELARLAEACGQRVVADVRSELDVRFQGAGDQEIAWPAFFGAQNLARIEEICGEVMPQLGYRPGASAV